MNTAPKKNPAREERVAAALRENLRKRKQQSQSRLRGADEGGVPQSSRDQDYVDKNDQTEDKKQCL